VTVIGESAGGASIMHQITAFGGLNGEIPFQQAIPQSPGFQVLPSNAVQEDTYQKTLMYASLISRKSITTTQQLRQLSTMELYYTNYAVVGLSAYSSFSYGPTVDGGFVPKLPGELLLHGQFHKNVKVMVGHNLNEGLLLTSPFIQNETALVSYLISIAPSASQSTINYITKMLYPPVFDGSYGYKNMIQRVALLLSEASFTCNTRYLDLAFQNKTYAYYFTVPPGFHGEDVSYTFFNGDTSTVDDGLPVNVTIAKALQDYITSFAMTGSPNEKGEPFFPLYGANSSTENIGLSNLGVQVPDTAANSRCDWWQKALYY
jgi:carboxylesterase type B